MKFRTIAVACCILLPGNSLMAQSPGTAADPISGTWKGSMGPDPATRHPITVELKFDGKTITGTITGPPQPGDIKSGTFDPRLGALKLDIVLRDDAINVTFEGTVVENTATGRVAFKNQTGNFIMTKASATSPTGAKPAGSDAMPALRKSFNQVSGWVRKAADLVPADKYTYRPTQGVRTFGELIAHIIDSYNFLCVAATGRHVEWSDATEKGSTDKATLAAKLEQSTETCNTAYAGSGDSGALVNTISHTNLHYGNVITYMRLLGLVPPSS